MKDKAGIGHNYNAAHPQKTKGSVEPADIYAGLVLKALREQQGLSQENLAEQTGITFQQIQKYEKGKNRMSVGRIDRISKILKVSPLVFFETDVATGSQKRRHEISVLDLTKEQQKLFKIMNKIPAEAQEEFCKITLQFLKIFAAGREDTE